MLKVIRHYGQATPSTGQYTSSTLDVRTLASSAHIRPSTWPNSDFGYAIEMPLRKGPHERVSSILACPRCTSSAWFVRLNLYGCTDNPTKPENWFGPLDRQDSSSTLWGRQLNHMKPPGAEGISGSAASTWYLGQTIQFDTQDFRYVGVLPQIASTTGGWTSLSGIVLDVFVQSATS